MLTAVVGAAVLALWGAMAWRDRSRRLSAESPAMTDVEEARLQAIADVPIEDIIAAAERRAEYPDEPLPQILADLDPETRKRPARTANPVIPVVSAPPPPPPPATWVTVSSPDVDMAAGLAVAPRPVRITARYDDCNHSDADREHVHTAAEAGPVHSFVTSCEQCDLIARYRQLSARIEELLAVAGTASTRAARATLNLAEVLMREADGIRRQLNDAEADKVSAALLQSTLDSLRTESSSA